MTRSRELAELASAYDGAVMSNARNLARLVVDEAGAISSNNLTNAPNPIVAGTIAYLGMNTAPSGWLKANGAAISRTTYAGLFAAIGTTYGAGDGSTTFNVPDLRGEFVRSLDDGRGVDSGRGIGTYQSSQNLSHYHNVPGYFVSRWLTYDGDVDGSAHATGYDKVTVDGGTYSDGGSEARPRNLALLACIKY